MSDIEKRIQDLLQESQKIDQPKKRGRPKKSVNQEAKGNNNIQIGEIKGNYAGRDYINGNITNITTTKAPDVKIMPSENSIGSDPLLKQAIIERFHKIGEAREKRFGKRAYTVMYAKFKKDFDIKNNKWTIIWDWPKACAEPIINYLDEKYNNTIEGKQEKAASKETYMHTRNHLYRIETELLKNIGLTMDSKEVKDWLNQFFSVTSHTKITHLQHWQFVCFLEDYVKKQIGEKR